MKNTFLNKSLYIEKKMVDSVVKDTNLYFELHFQDIKYFKYFFFISAW